MKKAWPIGIWLFAGATACNQPPRIDRVGEYLIADSILDFLNENSSTAPSFSVEAGEELSFTVDASDPDGDPVTLTVLPLPENSSFYPEERTFLWIPDPRQTAGVYYSLFVVAEDPDGAWDSVVVYLSAYPPATPTPAPTPLLTDSP